MQKYFKEIENKVKVAYSVAAEARKKGLDPVSLVEIPLATSLAQRVTGLISVKYPQIKDCGIEKRIKELEQLYGFLNPAICLQIAEEVAKEKFCKFQNLLEAIDAGIRIAFAYITLGVVSSPLEGYTHFTLKKNAEGKDYFAVYFSGPIRSAGSTTAAFSLLIIDHLREALGFARYDPSESEVKRMTTEIYDYHERVTNLQYLPTEKEMEFISKNLPIQVTGDPSEEKEVSNYKDLPRIETNRIRNGPCLVLAEGLAQKSLKILKRLNSLREKGFKLSGWDWLKDLTNLQKKIISEKEEKATGTYIQDIVAGRPVFAHPSRRGGFRLRYGRARTSGYSAIAVSPLTMAVSGNFIAAGTQLKLEKPTKAAIVSACDSIDGPTVKLKDGSVAKIKSKEQWDKLKSEIEEILYLGDILVCYGDFLNRNYPLLPAGYNEEWWLEELKEKLKKSNKKNDIKIDYKSISLEKAIELSLDYKIPLHPSHIFFWSQLNYELFFALLKWFEKAAFENGKIVLKYAEKDKKAKRALDLLGIEHKSMGGNFEIDEFNSKAFLLNLGLENISEISEILKQPENREGVLAFINSYSKFKIMDKAGTFIGARMGRPEKAKLRKLTGSPHVLFPVGEEGGRLRSVKEAVEKGKVTADFPINFCEKCKKETIYFICEDCGEKTKPLSYCPVCGRLVSSSCPQHGGIQAGKVKPFMEKSIDIKHYLEKAFKMLGMSKEEVPALIKGVRGTSSERHLPEHLAKGILRAQFNLNVNKDGTIRYDAIEMPITQFKPKEIDTSIEKLRELGYAKDIHGKELFDKDQLLDLKPQDVILPSSPESLDEKADDVFIRIAKFIDNLLVRFYGLRPFYNIKNRDDLVGHLITGIAPHNCAGVVCRIIGFSKTQTFLASPYIHAAMRRDCLDYCSYVPIKKDGNWQIMKIGEFIDRLNPTEKADNFGTLKKKVSNTFTFGNPGQEKIIEITKHQQRDMLRIFLEDGRKIELTKSHKLYIKGKKEKRAYELSPGDKLCVSYKKEIQEKDIKELFLPEIFKEREDIMLRNVCGYLSKLEDLSKHENFCQRDSFPVNFVEKLLNKHGKTLQNLPSQTRIAIKRDNVSIPIRISLDKELLEVIGLYIAEGFLRKNVSGKGFYQLSIAGNNEIKNLIKKVFSSSFNLEPSEDHFDHITFSSRIIYELFSYLKIGDKAKNKRIPSLFLNLKKEKIAALLRGYFEGDGSVSLTDTRVTCDTISEGLKYDLSFVLSRFNIFTKFYEYEKQPGPQDRNFYLKKNRPLPKFKATKIIIPPDFVKKFNQIGFLSEIKKGILDELCQRKPRGMRIDFDENYIYSKIKGIEEIGERESYCFNAENEHNFFANDILAHNCDGDEAAMMLLLDLLLNFSKEFLPAHRGGTQDAPLVLNARVRANEVDDMILDMDIMHNVPLELYRAAEEFKSPATVKVERVNNRLLSGGGDSAVFENLHFTHDTNDINAGVLCSAYKTLATMDDKVKHQMEIAEKIRAVDTADVARLVIERHFIRDIRGNLRKFSSQQFRCSTCNTKYRRPPLAGKCLKCGGKIIFTISEGSIIKYLEPAIALAKKYDVPKYVKQNLELTKLYIESIFGKELEKQEKIGKWFT